LADEVARAGAQLAHAQRECDQWKASYQNMVAELVEGTRPTPATTLRSDLAAQQRRRLNAATLGRPHEFALAGLYFCGMIGGEVTELERNQFPRRPATCTNTPQGAYALA